MSLAASSKNRLVRRPDVHTGMTVERGGDMQSLPHREEHAFDDPLVDLLARLAHLVFRPKARRARMEIAQPPLAQRISSEVQQFVRPVDRRATLRRQVNAGSDSRADDGQRPDRHKRAYFSSSTGGGQ